jgi:hypothetical protein
MIPVVAVAVAVALSWVCSFILDEYSI